MGDDEKVTAKSKVWDRLFQVLAIMVIPLLGWGIKLEVNNAVQDERILELKKHKMEAQSMREATTKNTHALIRVETKLEAAAVTLKDIKDILRAP